MFPLLWLSYAFFIVYVTMLPFDFDQSVEHARWRLAAVSHNPFLSADGSRASRSDMLQNVVLFVPFGALAGLAILAQPRPLSLRERSRQQGSMIGGAPTVLLVSVFGGAGLSAAVETLQLFTVDRVSSLNDVLTNAVGALAGGIVVLLFSWAAERTRATPHVADFLHRCYPVLLWGGMAAIAAWHPFDATIDVSSVAGKVRALLGDPWQAGTIGDEAVEAVRYALFAASWGVIWKRWHFRHPVAAGITATALLGAVLEASQFFVLSRMPGLKDVGVAVVGGAAGAMVYRLGQRWSPSTTAAITIGTTWLATALMLLTPGLGSSGQQSVQLTPFLSYARPAPELMVSHVVELTLAFFPIGFAVGMIGRGRRVWLLTAVVAFILGVLLEYGQSWIIGRYADVTDAGVLLLGALAGAWAALPARPVPGRHSERIGR